MISYEVMAVTGIGEVRPGDDLATLIADAAPWLQDGDVLVVTSKIVSKAEGQLVEVPLGGPERAAARESVLRAETARPVAARGETRIVRTHHGFVMAAAGIDASNVDPTHLVLLPKDPDASARGLRATLRDRSGLDVAVVITDTMGRPWRFGLVDVAIGAAGLEALTDYRGTRDPYGNELVVTQVAVIDELAAAGELVKGKSDQVPVAVVRGLSRVLPRPADGDGAGAAALIRDAEGDLFSLGTAEAIAQGMRAVAEITDAPAFSAGGPSQGGDVEAAVSRAVGDRAMASGLASTFPRLAAADLTDARLRSLVPAHTAEIVVPWAPAADVWAIARAGAQVQRLRATLAADGLGSAWVEVDAAVLEGLVELPTDAVPLGVLAVGRA